MSSWVLGLFMMVGPQVRDQPDVFVAPDLKDPFTHRGGQIELPPKMDLLDPFKRLERRASNRSNRSAEVEQPMLDLLDPFGGRSH